MNTFAINPDEFRNYYVLFAPRKNNPPIVRCVCPNMRFLRAVLSNYGYKLPESGSFPVRFDDGLIVCTVSQFNNWCVNHGHLSSLLFAAELSVHETEEIG